MTALKKILLIEDDQKILQIYTAVLTDAGYTVEAATDSTQALAKTKSFKPDLIFLDIMIPGQSGLEVLGLLRSEPSYGSMETPIVILTNLGERDTVKLAEDRTANGYLVKANITNEDLIATVKSFENRQSKSP